MKKLSLPALADDAGHTLRGIVFSKPAPASKRLQLGNVAVCFLSVALLSACADTQQGRDKQTQGLAYGSGAGALIGLAVGSLTGDAGSGALIGAAVGASEGMKIATVADSNHVTRIRSTFATTEAWLDACQLSAQSRLKSATALLQRLDAETPKLRARLESARAMGDKPLLATAKKQAGELRKAAEREALAVRNEASMQGDIVADAGRASQKRMVQFSKTVSDLRKAAADLDRRAAALRALTVS